jgi:hypothetical protein
MMAESVGNAFADSAAQQGTAFAGSAAQGDPQAQYDQLRATKRVQLGLLVAFVTLLIFAGWFFSRKRDEKK